MSRFTALGSDLSKIPDTCPYAIGTNYVYCRGVLTVGRWLYADKLTKTVREAKMKKFQLVAIALMEVLVKWKNRCSMFKSNCSDRP